MFWVFVSFLRPPMKGGTSFAGNHDVHYKIQEGSQISLARDWSTSKLLPSVVLLMFWDEARKPGLGWLTKSAAKEKFNIQLWGIKSWRQNIKMKNILIKTTALVDQLATTSQISCFYEESHILMRFLHYNLGEYYNNVTAVYIVEVKINWSTWIWGKKKAVLPIQNVKKIKKSMLVSQWTK